ncbi:MAG: hypothetical protein ACRECV_17625, partial [Xanthobacteraceae bacterium]
IANRYSKLQLKLAIPPKSSIRRTSETGLRIAASRLGRFGQPAFGGERIDFDSASINAERAAGLAVSNRRRLEPHPERIFSMVFKALLLLPGGSDSGADLHPDLLRWRIRMTGIDYQLG